MKRVRLIALAVTILLLTGCGSKEAAVFVQPVDNLTKMGGIAPGDKFGGMVVSENVTEIQKDPDKTVEKLSVREGDDVTEGQELFSYDMDQLQLTLDKQRLELEQLKATIENYKVQISDLEKDRDRAWGNNKLQYTIQIQSMQVDLKEAELNQKAKETEVAQSEKILENATVVSPVTGRVQSISESGSDNYGNPLAYITIQQAGSYRVKGTLNEQQRGGIMEGNRITIISRTDSSQRWGGTVTLVDYENPTTGNNNEYYYGGNDDEMTSSSKYPFYVELDSSEGLILGQHVYMELETEDGAPSGLCIPGAFIGYDENGTAFVWADNGHGKLEKRTVVVGEYNYMNDTVEILDGLVEADFIAFPDDEVCVAGAPVTRTQPKTAEGGV